MYDVMLRLTALAIFICWGIYWVITQRTADREKPKTKQLPFFHKNNIRKLVLRLAEAILILQLLGLSLLQIPNRALNIQIIGLLMIIIGTSVAISARRTLGTNWAHAYEYQIKQKQELVTGGIYQYIRHPIYTGLALGLIGGELVAKSYLVFSALIIVAGAYYQARLEEKLLTKHFGEDYQSYMKRTKMFIPHLW